MNESRVVGNDAANRISLCRFINICPNRGKVRHLASANLVRWETLMTQSLKHSPDGLIEAFEHHLVYEVNMLRRQES